MWIKQSCDPRASYPAAMDIDSKGVGRSIRRIRKGRGFTLAKVERLSRGEIKASVLGSYERGSRALTIRRAIEIADFFQVPLAHLLDLSEPTQTCTHGFSLIFDLRVINAKPTLAPVKNFLGEIIKTRSDFNGEVISLRKSDLEVLALTLNTGKEKLITELLREKVLLQSFK